MKETDMKKNIKSFRGLTLMEGLLFLGLAAIVIVGAFALYNNASSTTKMNTAKTQLQTYVSGIQTLYATTNDYGGVNPAVVVGASIAPTNAVDGNTLVNPWGGNTDVVGGTREFTITFENVPKDACVSLLTGGLIEQGSVFEMGVTGNVVAGTVDPGAAIGMCGSDTDNDVVFVSR